MPYNSEQVSTETNTDNSRLVSFCVTDPNDVLTTEEVSKILRCSKDTVAKLAKSGRLRSVSLTTGGKKSLPRFLRRNVMAFLDGYQDEQPASPKPATGKKPKQVQLQRHSIMGIEH